MKSWEKIYRKSPKAYKYYSLLDQHPDMSKVARIFKKRGVKKVLDLGCGSGRNLFYLVKQGFEVDGIDIAPSGIRQIREKLRSKKADLKVADIFAKLPYPDNFFDAIISVQVLQHARENKIKKAISELIKILKPRGLLFVTLCGRYSNGKLRYCLVKTAKKIAPNTYVPIIGNEKGLTHFIYNKKLVLKHFRAFELISLWKDDKDYYCFLGQNIK